MANQFKIDVYDSPYFPFGLYVLKPCAGWKAARWQYIERFKTRDEAKEFYAAIKDLPEYLN